MKKFLAILLTVLMVMSMSVAFAAPYTENEVKFDKIYNVVGSGAVSPAETFTYTVEKAGISEGGVNAAFPDALPTVESATYTQGEAGSATKTKTLKITLPTYSVVGIYNYTITETVGDTAGVEYRTDSFRLVVTVVQEANGMVRIGAVHTEAANGQKNDEVINTYSAGQLTVSKTVTGELGDHNADFTVKVTFNLNNKELKAPIYVGEGESKTAFIDASATESKTGTVESTYTLSHGESFTLTNIPYGVTYTVEEIGDNVGAAGSGKEYIVTYTGKTTATVGTGDAANTVQIENNKTAVPDTGIVLDNLPYIMIMAFVVIAAVSMMKRRAYNA